MKKIPFILISFVVVWGFAQAQVILDQIVINVNPTTPQPGQEVRLQVVSPAFDLARSNITWLKDGKVVLKGLGETAYFFTAGNLGERTTIRVQAETPDGLRLEDSKTITVAGAILVWSAFTTIPMGYQGRALASPNSLVRITAIPFIPKSGSGFEPKTRLIFTWYLNDQIKGSSSGTGRDFFDFRTDPAPGNDALVRVKVENQAKTLIVETEVVVPVFDTKILLYESHPVLGPKMGRVVEDIILYQGEEKRFSGQPFFFDSTKSSTLRVRWLLDGAELPNTPQQENVVTIKAPIGLLQELRQRLTAIFSNARNIYQETRKNFTIIVRP